MKTLSLATVAALLCGLLACLAIRWLWPDIGLESFSNVIGLIALLGAGLGAWLARRGAKPEAPVLPRSVKPRSKRRHGAAAK